MGQFDFQEHSVGTSVVQGISEHKGSAVSCSLIHIPKSESKWKICSWRKSW